MSEDQKLIAKLAAKFMVAHIQSGNVIKDTAYAFRCVKMAKAILTETVK